MLFNKQKNQLTKDDANKYMELFVDRTHHAAKSIANSMPTTLQLFVIEDEPVAWLDAVSVWHQALIREQLMMLATAFYGGETVEKQALSVLDEIERLRSEKGMMKQDLATFTKRIEKSTDILINAGAETRHFNMLVSLTTPLLAEDMQTCMYVEKLASDLRTSHIAFWIKLGYCAKAFGR